jgi:hypothetical protein
MANYDGFIESLAAKVWHLAHRTPALAMTDGTFIFAHGKAAVRVLVVLSAYGMCVATIQAAIAMCGVARMQVHARHRSLRLALIWFQNTILTPRRANDFLTSCCQQRVLHALVVASLPGPCRAQLLHKGAQVKS